VKIRRSFSFQEVTFTSRLHGHHLKKAFTVPRNSTFVRNLLIAACICSFPGSVLAQTNSSLEFIGVAAIPGDAVDKSGESTVLENGEPANRLGGFSAIDYSGTGHRFAALSDRGPDDGAVAYRCRVQMMDIAIEPGSSEPVSVQVVSSILLTDGEGRFFTGSSAAIQPTSKTSHRLDPEGFRFGPNDTMFVSDEYGPLLLQFSLSGVEQKRFPLPDYFMIAAPDANKKKENAANETGRASNRGMECLALSSDGQFLVALMQGPILQDGLRRDDHSVIGRNCRLVLTNIATGQHSEYVYQLDSSDNGNSEIVALGPDEYLVLERDSFAGEQAAFRKLIHIDLTDATNIAGTQALPNDTLPKSVHPVKKRVFLDLLDPQWKLAGASMPEKIEGLTFGPSLPDGRRTLVIGTDNDFESLNPSLIWVFAVQP
jgi:hypothetical protein